MISEAKFPDEMSHERLPRPGKQLRAIGILETPLLTNDLCKIDAIIVDTSEDASDLSTVSHPDGH